MEVVVRRAWNVYAAVAMSVAAGLAAAPALAAAARLASGLGAPLAACLAAAVAAAVVAAHELLHLAWARRLGVGARLRFAPRLLALALDYDAMSPRQYASVALAPQLLTLALAASAALLNAAGLGVAASLALLGAAVNLVGGVPELVLSAYFRLAHPRARRLALLYDESGGIAGGVVEEPGRIVVYVF